MASSLLATDGYKFSMAEAGWPLRQETFYYCHRLGGPQYLPVDVGSFLASIWPEPHAEDYSYLETHEYEMGCGFKAAILQRSRLVVRALPKGSWFLPREPIATVSGPSALVSWVEPMLLMLNFRIQVATTALTDPELLARELATLTCDDQKRIVLETLDVVGVKPPEIRVDAEAYRRRVFEAASGLVRIVGDPARLFEVGMRAASCLEQHEIALKACRDAGVIRTSNVLLARNLDMIPIGTMGHEHVQRYGSDRAAFLAMRERRPKRSSFLLDTFDTLGSGLPAALDLIREDPSRGDSIRYDSGDKESQYSTACRRARELGIRPVHILEDGFDEAQTRRFEELRKETGLGPAEQFYGYGGFLVARPSSCGLTRDRVSAVWKLTQTGPTPTMKFSDEPGHGKESVPGIPVVFRRQPGTGGPPGLIGQEGEAPPPGYRLLTTVAGSPAEATGAGAAAAPAARADLTGAVGLSEATTALVGRLRRP